MTVFDLLLKSMPALSGLRDELVRIRDKYPDTAPTLDPKIAVLDAVATPAGLVALAQTVVQELGNPSQFFKDPKDSPSNLAG